MAGIRRRIPSPIDLGGGDPARGITFFSFQFPFKSFSLHAELNKWLKHVLLAKGLVL